MAPVAEQKKEKETTTDKKEESKSKDETKKEEEPELVTVCFWSCSNFSQVHSRNTKDSRSFNNVTHQVFCVVTATTFYCSR